MLPSLERHAAARTAGDRADPSYWTAYDHFMLEREARALRRAYLRSLIAHAWHSLRARIAGARHDDGHRSVRPLSPRT